MTRVIKIPVLTTFLLLYFLTTTHNAASNGQNLTSYEIVRGGKNLWTEKRTEISRSKDIRTIFKH